MKRGPAGPGGNDSRVIEGDYDSPNHKITWEHFSDLQKIDCIFLQIKINTIIITALFLDQLSLLFQNCLTMPAMYPGKDFCHAEYTSIRTCGPEMLGSAASEGMKSRTTDSIRLRLAPHVNRTTHRPLSGTNRKISSSSFDLCLQISSSTSESDVRESNVPDT